MFLVSCGTDLKLHNCSTYELVHVYRPADSTGQIRNVSWCKDGSWLALVPNRGNAEIVRTKEDVRLLQTILGVTQPTSAVFQRTTKRNMAMSTINGGVLVYDIKGKSVKKRFVNSGSSVTILDWSLKDTHLAAGSTDGQVTLYSNTTNQKINVFTIPDSKSVSVVRFHTFQRSVLGTASDEGVIAVWDINTGRQKMCLKPHKAPVTDLVFSSQNSNLMVSVGLDRTFMCYDTNTKAVALSVMTDHPLSAIDMAADGVTIAVASSRGTIYIYDLRNNEKPMKTIAAHSGEIKKILYQPTTTDNTDSVQITEDKSAEMLVETKPRNMSADSFTNVINEFSVTVDRRNECELMEQEETASVKQESNSAAGDSFLNCIDNFGSMKKISSNLTRETSDLSNLGLSDSVKKWLDAKKNNNIEVQSSQSSESVNGKLSDEAPTIPVIKLAASTPRQNGGDRVSCIQNQERQPNLSPILPIGASITQEELNKLIRNNVDEIVSEQMSELMDSLSKYFLDLQMSFSKQFVNQESHIERLFGYYCGSNSSSTVNAQLQQLQQENEFLKRQMTELFRKNNS